MSQDSTTTERSDREITTGFPEAGEPRFESIDAVRAGLAGVDYLADDGISVSSTWRTDWPSRSWSRDRPARARPSWRSPWPGSPAAG